MTSPDEDPVAALGVALTQSNATAKLNRKRIVRSTLHDANYHAAVIACAMRVHAEGNQRRVLAAWLKLLQFVAARPSLLENLLEYARSRRTGELQKWALMPRGYMGDQTHDGVVDFLVAASILRRDGDYLEAGVRYAILEQFAADIEASEMFAGEREILNRLREIKPNKVMLGAHDPHRIDRSVRTYGARTVHGTDGVRERAQCLFWGKRVRKEHGDHCDPVVPRH